MLSEWHYADSEGARGSYHPEVGLIRGPRQRKGSMQGRQESASQDRIQADGVSPGRYPGVGCSPQGGPSWWLRAGGCIQALSVGGGGSAFPQVMPTWLPDFTIWGHLKDN